MSKDERTIINFAQPKLPELPIKTATTTLTQTEGRGLKQNTRANRPLIDAVMFGYPWVQRWGDDYVKNMLDDMMSLAIGVDGQGRRDIIDCLDAGGQIPDAYFNSLNENKRGDTAYLRRNE